ncbi:MAG TPA: hypothetical protein VKT99_13410 [Xanthobacteraceae bacterium]|jgi:hypothetical protein|nr:hypothetical protein [Xanthobacteraceae bacterium]
MSTGRIEGDRRVMALAGAVAPTLVVPADHKPSGTTSIAAPKPVDQREFETLIGVAGRRASPAAIRSPHQCIVDFVMPRISDPTIFQGGRSISILEQLASEILPHLEESDELRSLAGAIIADEIARHRELLIRLHSGIAA